MSEILPYILDFS